MDSLSDRQLAIADWLYGKRAIFIATAQAVLFFTAITVFLGLLINTVLYIISIKPHNLTVFYSTQKMILKQDTTLLLAPLSLKTDQINVVSHKDGTKDLLAVVENPNKQWAAVFFEYAFVFDGIETIHQKSFALPGKNYFVGFKTDSSKSDNISLKIFNTQWYKMQFPVDIERLSLLNIAVVQSKFIPGDKEGVVDIAKARIKNKTPFNFWRAEVIAIAYQKNKIAAVGATSIENFISGEEREVEIGFGTLPMTDVDRIEIIPKVNILDKDNLLQP